MLIKEFTELVAAHRRPGGRTDPGGPFQRPEGVLPPAGLTVRDRSLARTLLEAGWQILLRGTPGFPVRLEEELGDDCPPLLYAMGDAALADTPALAIIGTRRPSPEGRQAAVSYSGAIVRHRKCVVSGNAPGVDAAAHRGALEAGGITVVYPPVPPDQFVPAFDLARNRGRVLVLSAFAPGSIVEAWMFLARNQLVAAHCRAALVAETGVRGGTLNTVSHLRRLGRAAFCVELPEKSPRHYAHELLRAGGCQMLPPVADTGSVAGLLQAMRRSHSVVSARQTDLFSGEQGP